MFRRTAIAFAMMLALLGCGRKATLEDCQMVVDRNVEVEMKRQKVTDSAQIDKRKTEIRKELEPLVKECVGKRVTDSMMKCVKNADTSAAIDECMR